MPQNYEKQFSEKAVSDKHLKLRANPASRLGLTISYLQALDTDTTRIAGSTLESRFLPFTLDRHDPNWVGIAIQCAAECEAWAKAIRDYLALHTTSPEIVQAPKMLTIVNGNGHAQNGSKQTSIDDGNEDEDLTPESVDCLEEQHQGIDLMKNMGLL